MRALVDAREIRAEGDGGAGREPRRVEGRKDAKSSLPLSRREGGGRLAWRAAEIATGLSVSLPVYEPRPLQAR